MSERKPLREDLPSSGIREDSSKKDSTTIVVTSKEQAEELAKRLSSRSIEENKSQRRILTEDS